LVSSHASANTRRWNSSRLNSRLNNVGVADVCFSADAFVVCAPSSSVVCRPPSLTVMRPPCLSLSSIVCQPQVCGYACSNGGIIRRGIRASAVCLHFTAARCLAHADDGRTGESPLPDSLRCNHHSQPARISFAREKAQYFNIYGQTVACSHDTPSRRLHRFH